MTFSESVTGVSTDDFALTTNGNVSGITRHRLRFQVGDDNFRNDYIRFFSGDYDDLALPPRLVSEYYVQ